MERLFYCTESENIYTLSDLEEMRKLSIEDGNTFCTETLADFIRACSVENNGTLVEIKITRKGYSAGKLVFVQSNLYSDLY